jgi:transposase
MPRVSFVTMTVRDELVSIKAAAETLHMSRATIRDWIEEGLIRVHGDGPRAARLISLSEVRQARRARRDAFDSIPGHERRRSQSGWVVRGPDKQSRKRDRPQPRECETCGSTYTPTRKRSDRTGRFCTLECYRRRKHPKPEPRPCETCGSTFTPTNVSSYVGRFCSRACKTEAMKKGPDPKPRKCPVCGKVFTPEHPCEDRVKCCSQACRANYHADAWSRGMAWRQRQKTLGKVKGRVSGRTRPGSGRPRGYTDKQAEHVLALKQSHPFWGYATIAEESGLTVKQVRGLLAREVALP